MEVEQCSHLLMIPTVSVNFHMMCVILHTVMSQKTLNFTFIALSFSAGFLSSSLLLKNLKIKIYRTIILPLVLYVCETWSFTLREERRLRVF